MDEGRGGGEREGRIQEWGASYRGGQKVAICINTLS